MANVFGELHFLSVENGVGCGIDAGTNLAVIVEASFEKSSGEVKVKRVVCAKDMSIVVNPAGATQQVEGCITMGLRYALRERIRFRDGEILDRNSDTYENPRFSQVPRIETVLIDDRDTAPQAGVNRQSWAWAG
jgi:nicotinate dehydrogenase subunit B